MDSCKISVPSVFSGQIDTSSENKLYYKRIHKETSNQTSKVELLFIHDILGMHSDDEELAYELVSSSREGDISAVLLDLRGHGLSSGSRAHVESYIEYLDDIKSLLCELNKTVGKRKRIIFSTGIGTIIAIKSFLDFKMSIDFCGCILREPHFLKTSLLSQLISKTLTFMPIRRMRYASVQSENRSFHFNHKKMSANLYQELIDLSKDVITNSFYISRPTMILCENSLDTSDCYQSINRRIASKYLTTFELCKKHHKDLNENRDILVKEIYNWISQFIVE